MSEAPQKKGTSWSIGIGLGIAALLIGTAILTDPSVSGSAGEKDKAAAGTVEPLHLQTNTLAISAPGIVKASHLTMLSPGVSGKVDKVHPLFSAGEIVLKGTPLLELEKFEYRARLANAQAGLEQARLDVSTEQAEALKAIKKTYSSVSKSGKESELVLRVPQRRAVNARLNAAEAYVAEAGHGAGSSLYLPGGGMLRGSRGPRGCRAAGGEGDSPPGADDTGSRAAGRIFRIAQG